MCVDYPRDVDVVVKQGTGFILQTAKTLSAYQLLGVLHIYRMPRGLPSCKGLLNFRKGLNDNGNGLIQSIFRNNFSSRAQGVRCLSSLHVTPEGPAIDKLFELQVCILYFHTYQRLTQLNSSLTRLVNWSPTLQPVYRYPFHQLHHNFSAPSWT